MLKQLFSKISTKIVLFSCFSLLFLGAAITLSSTYITYKNEIKQTRVLEKLLKDDFDRLIRNEVETALSMLNHINQQVESGAITLEEGQLMGATYLRSLSYGADGYFWADTKDGVNVVLLGNTEVEGKSRWNSQDANGTKFIQDILAAGIAGGGYCEYWFPKKGSDQPLPKRSYSKLFEPFGWVIGTGNYIDDIEKEVNAITQERLEEFKSMIRIVMSIALIALLTSIGLAWWLGRMISNPIVDLTRKTSLMAEGDLTISLHSNLADETGVLTRSVNAMAEKLREIVKEITTGAENVVAASGQMSSAAQVIANGASEQAASTEQISTSVEEMVSSIVQNTHNANHTETLTSQTEVSIQDLQEALKETLDSMTEIVTKTKIINQISMQTNLLALNAAVEAARAGDSGRGFAVVAGEVRKLSENTQQAAKVIDLLSKSSLTVTERAWGLLEKVIPEFRQTNNLVKEISFSSNEQRLGAEQINSAIQQMVSVTSQNSASSEELASSSEELASQAENLKDLVSYFKTN
jgi:methyl-accepting chemotaxis protein